MNCVGNPGLGTFEKGKNFLTARLGGSLALPIPWQKRKCSTIFALIMICCLCVTPIIWAQRKSADSQPLASTAPLTMEGDLAAQMVAGIDNFLLKQWEQTEKERTKYWQELLADKARQEKEFPLLRQQLAKMLGAHETRIGPTGLVPYPVTHLAEYEKFNVSSFSWPVIRDVTVEGLLLEPKGKADSDLFIIIPDVEQTPESLLGWTGTIPQKKLLPLYLANIDFRVIIPVLIDRKMEKRNGRSVLSSREYAYRPAFELGRHIIGYELQKVFTLIDWSSRQKPRDVILLGHGEGGMLALFTAALDSRIKSFDVSGYYSSHPAAWNEPLDRNVFGLNKRFGNAELAVLASQHAEVGISACIGPEVSLSGSGGGAPSEIKMTQEEMERENDKAVLYKIPQSRFKYHPREKEDYWGEAEYLYASLPVKKGRDKPEPIKPISQVFSPETLEKSIATRTTRQLDQILNDTQRLLAESPYVRQQYMKDLDTSSLQNFQASVEPYREKFATEVIGRFDIPLLPPAPRTRQVYDEEKWTGYEVVLDVFPDVYAYGLLLLPKDLKDGERRPVVVCQHGLEGRPQDVIGDEKRNIYEAFAAQLAERGFITFAPQNLYIGKDAFRTLQRKANPLGKTLFSIIVPQHQQIVNWLGSLPMVDKNRIAFYGLSYGGKSAMRIPPLVPEYSAVICSADFNEWVWKNASLKAPFSYVWTGEYEIFEWDLGSTFNYAEMAALICPRPFMVERGHFDGVSSDEAVAYEFAKVQHLYQAKLKLPGKCEIEFFDGPHKINGKGTFDFLHRHLNWPMKRE